MGKKKKAVQLIPEQVIRMKQKRLMDREDVRQLMTHLVLIAIVLYLLFGVFFGITSVKNKDMVPRLSAGDLLLYYRLEENLRSQDIIVFDKNGKEYVGRIIAKCGESVEITEEGRVKINGSTVIESDIYYSTPRYVNDITYPVLLADDEYFILCDYRDNAVDSRSLGPVKKSEMKGKVISVLRRSNL